MFERDPYAAAAGAHAVAVLTEWDIYRKLDYPRIFDSMVKLAFIFDGRNILDHQALHAIGFNVYSIGKMPLPFRAAPAPAGTRQHGGCRASASEAGDALAQVLDVLPHLRALVARSRRSGEIRRQARRESPTPAARRCVAGSRRR